MIIDRNTCKTLIAIFVNVFKGDGGDGMVIPSLDHVATQAPLLGVSAELQDLVTIVNIISTWV